MPRLVWKLPELLEREGIALRVLTKTLAGKIPRMTVYRWATSNQQQIQFEPTAHLIWALHQLTGKTFSLSDLIEYEE
jgi:hypothetical protein